MVSACSLCVADRTFFAGPTSEITTSAPALASGAT
jgi:hypothetical protein